MALPFGFSVGDFIAVLELVDTVSASLSEAGGAGPEFHELLHQLFALEYALLRVTQLEVEDAQRSEYIALRQVACQCQLTIDNFWHRMKKYQKHLRTGDSGSQLRDGWMKIKWALCKSEDVAKFKVDIAAHTQSILLLLSTLQLVSNGRKAL
jgi:hypothetical protein